MPREIAVLDALVPTLLLVFLASVLLQGVVDRIIAWSGIYRHVWHPPLFRLLTFVCIFTACSLCLW